MKNKVWLFLQLLAAMAPGCSILPPGRSYRGPLPPMTADDEATREGIRKHVDVLADLIGIRNVERPGSPDSSVTYISKFWRDLGYEVEEQPYDCDGRVVKNLIVQIAGSTRADEIIVVGSHYDSVISTPGANDNGSGIAGTMELSRILRDSHPARTIRFVAFVNEEPPFFRTQLMGSRVYAKRCRARNEKIAGMITLETIGCYFDEPHTQSYPAPLGWFMPDEGNFIAFVANFESRELLQEVGRSFRATTDFPSVGAALPGWIDGIGWSDHESFWLAGYPAVMVTDTAPYRYRHYHLPTDTPDKIDYDRTARVVNGMAKVVSELANR